MEAKAEKRRLSKYSPITIINIPAQRETFEKNRNCGEFSITVFSLALWVSGHKLTCRSHKDLRVRLEAECMKMAQNALTAQQYANFGSAP